MNKETKTKIYITDEYEKFKLASWNRKVNYTKVGQLEKSLLKYGYIGSPIVVNQEMIIIDGQHRYIACQKSNIPIQYMIVDGLDVEYAITLNAYQTPWKLTDYVNSYVEQNNINYIRFNKLMSEFKTGIDITLCAVDCNSAARGNGNKIKNGNLEITEEQYESARNTLNWLIQFKPYQIYFGGDVRTTMACLVKLYKLSLIDDERMLEQFDKYGDEYLPRGNILDCMRSLNEIYNISKKKKVYFVDTFRSLVNE